MTLSPPHFSLVPSTATISARQSGQAMIELVLMVPLMCLILFAIIDYSRALNDEQVMVDLSRQGSNMASRGTALAAAANALVQGSPPLNLATAGEVIITSVARVGSTDTIMGQVIRSAGSVTTASKIGTGVGSKAIVPAVIDDVFSKNSGQTVYITEVYYPFQGITPLASMWNIIIPSILYQAAYF
ncbi:MAG TPA: TadE/TadG family type IV pilus assembly protein [Candidatus Binataceae bacterium]|nr:TadE/TadG family type IV pilus assembly protein [Candidatus Binataceae bacterium]